jgi:hypothetical protein
VYHHIFLAVTVALASPPARDPVNLNADGWIAFTRMRNRK